jgi:hypothetical protein
MEQSSSWEATSRSASQEILRLKWNQNFHDRIQQNSPVVPILSLMNPVHINANCIHAHVVEQKTAIFIITVVRTSNPTFCIILYYIMTFFLRNLLIFIICIFLSYVYRKLNCEISQKCYRVWIVNISYLKITLDDKNMIFCTTWQHAWRNKLPNVRSVAVYSAHLTIHRL